jgi:thioredoxin-related protein
VKKALIVFLFSQILFADVVWEANWEKAKAKAKAENKVILMVVSQEGCPACKRLKKDINERETIANEIRKNYIATNFDKSDLPINKRVRWTPTTFFFTPEGKRLKYNIVGGKSYKELSKILQKISQKVLKK